jgi:transcription elongation factor Elf1
MRSLNGILRENMMTKILQKEPIKIDCPHCKVETSDIWICQLDSVIGMRYAYLCSNCEKLMAVSKNLLSTSSILKSQIKFTPN